MRAGWRTSSLPLALPFLVGLALLVGLPLVGTLGLALTDFSGLARPSFVGLDNFARLADDRLFRLALANTAAFLAVSVPLRLLGAGGLALLLARRGPAVGAARASAFLPSVLPDAAIGLLGLWLLNPLYGPLAAAARSVGLTPDWLVDPAAARVALAVLSAVQLGEGLVIALAWRRAIPARLYEAAAVEGASPWFTLRRVTLPLMAPALALLALRDVVLSLSAGFVPALVITDGGPRQATTFVSTFVYRAGFRYFRQGYASAASVTLLVTALVLALLQLRLARRWGWVR